LEKSTPIIATGCTVGSRSSFEIGRIGRFMWFVKMGKFPMKSPVYGWLTWLLLLFITFILVGCGRNGEFALDNEPDANARVQEEFKASPNSPLPIGSVEVPAKVTRVVDGDTFDVVLAGGSHERVRLLGVDTPETFATNKPNEYGNITDTACLRNWGLQATKFAVGLIENKKVTLVSDPVAGVRGFYDRMLAYVHVDGRDVSSLLLEAGYARVYIEGDSIREKEYLLLEADAQVRKVGLWSCSGFTKLKALASPVSVSYDPFGPDRDCGDFGSWEEAQAFFKAAGGPSTDHHRLDGDKNGIACESLPSVP
jgi:micrococcal nuclease